VHNFLGGILRSGFRFGNDDGHAIAYMIDFANGERPVRRLLHLFADLPTRRNRVDAVVLHVLPREDSDYAVMVEGRLDVDAVDAGVRVRATDDDRIGHVRQHDVVGVVAATRRKPPVLNTLYRASNIFGHCCWELGMGVLENGNWELEIGYWETGMGKGSIHVTICHFLFSFS
jgi:hypothetical protein